MTPPKNELCAEHVGQATALSSFGSKLNMLMGLTGGCGSIIIYILISINTTTSSLAVSVAEVNVNIKVLSERVSVVEKRLNWCEKEIRSLKEMNRSSRKRKPLE